MHVRARDMRVHFDSTEAMHIPATPESVNMLLTELSPRKGERHRKKKQHSCTDAFRDMLQEEDRGRVAWRGHSWQVLWRSADGGNRKTVSGFRVRDTGETVRDTAMARTALRRARALWIQCACSGEAPYPSDLL